MRINPNRRIVANKKGGVASILGIATLTLFLLLLGAAMFASPAFADDSFGYDDDGRITSLGGLILRLQVILNTIVPFLVGLGVFIIIYGVFGYIRHSAEEEKRAESKMFVVWGVIMVFLMVSIWGLVSILVNTLPLRNTPVRTPSIFPGAGDASDPCAGLSDADCEDYYSASI